MENKTPHFGEIYIADLQEDVNIQGGVRPVLISQNTIRGNTVEVIPMTTKLKALYMPTHVIITPSTENGLPKQSMVLAEQTTTINVGRLQRKLGTMSRNDLIKTGGARQSQSHFST